MSKWIFVFLIFLTTEITFARLEIATNSVWCFYDNCYVDFEYPGDDPAKYAEDPNLETCGAADEVNSFHAQHGIVGRSRYSLRFFQNRELIMRTCNAQTLPSYVDGFQHPTSSIVVDKRNLPGNINVVLRDRVNNQKEKVTVPVNLPTPLKCDFKMQPRQGGDLSFKGISLQKHKPVTFCFNPENTNFKSRRFFEVHTTNLSNAQCSHLLLKLISPSGKETGGSGWQPSTSGKTEVGEWKIQLFLHDGCNRFNLSVH